MKLGSRTIALWAVAVVALGALGCLTATQDRQSTLTRAARMFNDDWRWARWDSMVASMPADEGSLFRKRVDSLEDELEIADFEVLSINFGEDSTSATVVAEFQWFYKSDLRVHRTTVSQSWEHNGGWQMTEVRRTKGDRFGLVLEPVEPPEPAITPTP